MYTLRFPFKLPPSQKISSTEHCEQRADLTYSLKKNDEQYVLTVTGFSSQESAEKYISVIRSGLAWVLLNKGLSFQADTELQNIAYTKDPYEAAKNLSKNFGITIKGGMERVDGLIDSNRPAVYASDKTIRTSTVGTPHSIVVITIASDMFPLLLEGASFPHASNLVTDRKLLLALELYGAYFTEYSINAKFLTLVMALEVLASGRRRRRVVLDLLDKWIGEVKRLLEQPNLNQEDQESLEALKGELQARQEESIRRKIRALVHDTLAKNDDADAYNTARQAVQIYDQRSTLVHNGTLPVSELRSATRNAKRIMERLLKAIYLSSVS
jgi:hypothetical protein